MKTSFSIPFVPPKRIPRRQMILGGAAAIGLPMLEAMASNPFIRVQGGISSAPVRLGYFYFPNGSEPNSWDPASTDSNQRLKKLNRWMAPLEKHKENIVLLRNVWTPRGNGHGAGTATWLTGGGFDARKINAGVSVDQLAANHFKSTTMLPSLEISLKGQGYFSKSLSRNTLSWNAKGKPVPRETEPRSVFDRMFRGGQNGIGDKSVIDLAMDEAKQLKRQLGAGDSRKLDEYVEALRSVERRIEIASKNADLAKENQELKQFLKRPDAGIPNDHGEYMRLMYDMIVLAYWADATRVSSFMLDHGQSNRYFNFIEGVKGTWHAISHWRDTSGKTEDDDGIHSWNSREEKLKMYNRIVRWHHQQFAYFLERLGSIKEGESTLLDRCGILYGSSLSDGHEHGARNLPLILAGAAGGQIETGRMIKFRKQTSLSGIHLSLLSAGGIPVTDFADAKSPIDLKS